MTYGFIFYWLSWLFWGITTFFMKKSQLRTLLSSLILIVILSSTLNFSVGRYSILLLIIMVGFFYTNLLKPFYHFFSSFTLMIGYTAILLWKQSISMWLFFSSFLLLPLICCILVFLLVKGFYHRVVTCMLGATGGEVLHGLILSSYHLPITIGDLDFFVHLYIIVLYLLLLHIFQKAKLQLHLFMKNII